MAAFNMAECRQNLPILLEWLLSQIEIDAEETDIEEAEKPEKWLWLGLRAGTSLRLYNRSAEFEDWNIENEVSNFLNVNAAFQASLHVLPWLDVQAEVNFTTDSAPYTEKVTITKFPFNSQSLMFPLLARFNFRSNDFSVGALAGAYFFMPLGQMTNNQMGGAFAYKMDLPIGYMLGFNIGMKAGPGYLFLDARWAADLGTLKRASEGNGSESYFRSGAELYKRSMVMLNLGYEIGFFNKKPKEQ
jgi:hypothetical protein